MSSLLTRCAEGRAGRASSALYLDTTLKRGEMLENSLLARRYRKPWQLSACPGLRLAAVPPAIACCESGAHRVTDWMACCEVLIARR